MTLEATEADGSAPLTVLAFTQSDRADEAEQTAADELARLGWVAIVVVRSGEITKPDALPADFETAYANALRHGCALIIYEQP